MLYWSSLFELEIAETCFDRAVMWPPGDRLMNSSPEIVTVEGLLNKSFTHNCSAPSIDAWSLYSGA